MMLLVFVSYNSSTSTTSVGDDTADKAASGKKEISYPYSIGYSAQFEFIDAEKSKMVLGIWKDYDEVV